MSNREHRTVALVIPTYVPAVRYGGPILATHSLARSLAESGWRVAVLTSDGDGPGRLNVPPEVEIEGVRVRYLRRWAREALVPQVALALATLRPRPNVVHIGPPFASCTVFAHAAARVLGLPVVLSPRGSFDPWALKHKRLKKRIALWMLRPMLRTVTAVHATSDSESQAAARLLPQTLVRVVPNGVELPPASAKPAANGAPPTVLFLGRLHPVKGIDRLLEGCAILSRKSRSFRVVVAGGGETQYRSELLQRQHALGLDDRVDWLGVAEGSDKWRLLAQARLLVLPSHSESFGNVVLEALASGRPVVASTGTPWQKVETTRCGRWVANDPESLAGAIEPYLLDSRLADEDGARGRGLVESQYTWRRIAAAMSDLYQQAIDLYRPRLRKVA